MLPVLVAMMMMMMVTGAGARLAQVQILARHGLRDYYTAEADASWDDGGVLSGHGYKAMYDLGEAVRNRYNRSSNDTAASWARSTDSEAAMMSASAFFLGYVPPGAGPIDEVTKTAAIPNQTAPVPVHTVPFFEDILLRAYDKCPTLANAYDAAYNGDDFASFRAAYQHELDFLTAILGRNVTWETFLTEYEILYIRRAFPDATVFIPEDHWVRRAFRLSEFRTMTDHAT